MSNSQETTRLNDDESIRETNTSSVTNADDYHYLVYQNPDKTGWIGICLEFPNLSINDSTSEKCLNRLINCINDMIDCAKILKVLHTIPNPIDNLYLTNLIENVITPLNN